MGNPDLPRQEEIREAQMATIDGANATVYERELPEFRTFTEGRKWFSANDDKAWTEKLYLIFIPFWFAYNGLVQQMGWLDTNTFWHVTQNFIMMLPYFLVPFLLKRKSPVPFYRQFWFRFQVYMVVLVFWVTYWHTEYFFDVLHMRYNFPNVTWYFDSMLLGPDQATALENEERIPVGMYLNTIAFFTSYHIAAVVVMRRLFNFARNAGATGRALAFIAAVIATSIFFAWAETFFYMTAAANGIVYYENLPDMLAVGSWFYALYFYVQFPNIYRLDEDPKRAPWSLWRCVAEASAAALFVLLLLDLWVMYFGFDFIPLPAA
jgi:cycloeucalenol cycloisomerase